MGLPFQREINETFRRDQSLGLKVAGSVGVTILVAERGVYKLIDDGSLKMEFTAPTIVATALIAGGVGAILGLGLSLKDTVERRLDRGASVHPILRLYFGGGCLCLFSWFVTVILCSFAVTMMGISMKWF